MKSSSKSLSASLFLDDLLSKTLNRYQQKTSIDSGCPEGTTLVEEEYIKLQSVSPTPDSVPSGDSGRPSDWRSLCQRAYANRSRNRRDQFHPFDSHLFELELSGNRYGDEKGYINASWIDFAAGRRKYIVAMAPMDVETNRGRDQEEILVGSEREATSGDFWRMCWQTKCKFVVMLCDMSSGLSGCAKYFPLKPGRCSDKTKCVKRDVLFILIVLTDAMSFCLACFLNGTLSPGTHQQSDKYFPSPDLRLCTCSNDIFLASYNPEFIFHVALPQVLSFLFY